MADYGEDYLLDKRVKIFQPDDGYRASVDAVFCRRSSAAPPPANGFSTSVRAPAPFPCVWRTVFPPAKLPGLKFSPGWSNCPA